MFGSSGKGQGGSGGKAEKTLGDFTAEYAKSNRSTCKGCMEKIEKVALGSQYLHLWDLTLGGGVGYLRRKEQTASPFWLRTHGQKYSGEPCREGSDSSGQTESCALVQLPPWAGPWKKDLGKHQHRSLKSGSFGGVLV